MLVNCLQFTLQIVKDNPLNCVSSISSDNTYTKEGGFGGMEWGLLFATTSSASAEAPFHQ